MASVYFGQLIGPVGFSRVVAIKRMHPQFANDPKFVTMFVDEAWLTARVQHPNVVSTLDVVADAGELFIVMDYVRGEALSSILRAARVPVPPGVAASMTGQVLAGLHAAHEAKDETGRPLGMIHRDVSPQNVLVGVDGLARITDFGIAKAASRLYVTLEKQIKGKLRYMAPEQIVSAESLDRRADVYAMGVLLWETLAGAHLFKGDQIEQVLHLIMHQDPPSLAALRGDVPRAVDDVVRRAVARDPAQRFATAEEFHISLERALPFASHRAVGEWVQEVCAQPLREKKAIVDLIEQGLPSRSGVAAELRELSGSGERLADARHRDAAPLEAASPDGLGLGERSGMQLSRRAAQREEERTAVSGAPTRPDPPPHEEERTLVAPQPTSATARPGRPLAFASTELAESAAPSEAVSTRERPAATAPVPAATVPVPTTPVASPPRGAADPTRVSAGAAGGTLASMPAVRTVPVVAVRTLGARSAPPASAPEPSTAPLVGRGRGWAQAQAGPGTVREGEAPATVDDVPAPALAQPAARSRGAIAGAVAAAAVIAAAAMVFVLGGFAGAGAARTGAPAPERGSLASPAVPPSAGDAPTGAPTPLPPPVGASTASAAPSSSGAATPPVSSAKPLARPWAPPRPTARPVDPPAVFVPSDSL
jgi:serine/threonine-protein kinase